jgi:hypothetical protein
VALCAVQQNGGHGTGEKLGGLAGGVLFSSAARFLSHYRLVCHFPPLHLIAFNPIRRETSLSPEQAFLYKFRHVDAGFRSHSQTRAVFLS